MTLTKVRREEVAAFNSHALALAATLQIKTALVLADDFEQEVLQSYQQLPRVIWLVSDERKAPRGRPQDLVLPNPSAKLTRMSQVNLGLYAATLRGYIDLDETVMCLAGIPGLGQLDLMLVTRPNREFPWLRARDLDRTKDLVGSREFGRLLELALRFAVQGREGKPIGTLFVLGPIEQLSPFLRQLILNPCKGHGRRLRSIHNPEFAESLREFCALDGAVIVDRSGVVESVGTYLDAPTKHVRLRQGLGARHAAAAAITKATDAIALTISESSGTVMLFDDGKAVLELERPQ